MAAEDCDSDRFFEVHRFSRNDERIISKLIAHGPVLLQGGRGSGKSALMLAAARRLAVTGAPAFGVYLSLRHLPLLRSKGPEYDQLFCELLTQRVQEELGTREIDLDFRQNRRHRLFSRLLPNCQESLNNAFVLFFDDAAHIGREASLSDFFDIFRTLSSSTVSCKATIYPGVTQFGTRFDVYNDATVIDVIRNEEQPEFSQLFADVARARWPGFDAREFTAPFTLDSIAAFLAQSVLGNMRGFVFACNDLLDNHAEGSIGLKSVGDTMMNLATNYYWPLLDEVEPKLGKYVPMVASSRTIAEELFHTCGTKRRRGALVHRDIIARLSKPFEILEYVGFISRREASRAMKSGRARRAVRLESLQPSRTFSDGAAHFRLVRALAKF